MNHHTFQNVPGYEDLAWCTRCRCAEGTLPTNCPEVPVPTRVQNLIIQGVVDFVGDRWIGKRRPLRLIISLGAPIHELAKTLQRAGQMFRDAMPSVEDFARTMRRPGPITPEMVREALAHAPFALSNPERWEWVARFLNDAVAFPDWPCPCCNVTPAGDILDHLPIPREEFRKEVSAARDVWMAENPCEDGRDHVTPFDRFLY